MMFSLTRTSRFMQGMSQQAPSAREKHSRARHRS